MSAFADAVGAIFNDPNLSVEAIYRPGGVGDGRAVRVIRRAPDVIGDFGIGRFITSAVRLDVPMEDVPELAEKDTFEIDGEVLVVRSEPIRDAHRLIWKAEARRA